MKRRVIAAAAVAVLPILAAVAPAESKGCIKGAVVGGVAGHYAGHHGVLGAIGGCVVGHHMASENDKRAAQQAPNPPPQTNDH